MRIFAPNRAQCQKEWLKTDLSRFPASLADGRAKKRISPVKISATADARVRNTGNARARMYACVGAREYLRISRCMHVSIRVTAIIMTAM